MYSTHSKKEIQYFYKKRWNNNFLLYNWFFIYIKKITVLGGGIGGTAPLAPLVPPLMMILLDLLLLLPSITGILLHNPLLFRSVVCWITASLFIVHSCVGPPCRQAEDGWIPRRPPWLPPIAACEHPRSSLIWSKTHQSSHPPNVLTSLRFAVPMCFHTFQKELD